ncbi:MULTISPECIES: BON domain-containing protein [unclassified Streptomyces]|jgi:osmotically-inducible protein OsmY|uniref:BON domain-containing protein n=1 Tax=unclassified Streptomyces TaxID=2593676 RepID=UPI0036FB9A1F
MKTHDAASTGGTAAGRTTEYRVAHLQDRLASGELGELGVRVEVRGGSVLVTGTVPSAGCREDVLSTVRGELAGLEVHCDIVISEPSSPDHAEELS